MFVLVLWVQNGTELLGRKVSAVTTQKCELYTVLASSCSEYGDRLPSTKEDASPAADITQTWVCCRGFSSTVRNDDVRKFFAGSFPWLFCARVCERSGLCVTRFQRNQVPVPYSRLGFRPW